MNLGLPTALGVQGPCSERLRSASSDSLDYYLPLIVSRPHSHTLSGSGSKQHLPGWSVRGPGSYPFIQAHHRHLLHPSSISVPFLAFCQSSHLRRGSQHLRSQSPSFISHPPTLTAGPHLYLGLLRPLGTPMRANHSLATVNSFHNSGEHIPHHWRRQTFPTSYSSPSLL